MTATGSTLYTRDIRHEKLLRPKFWRPSHRYFTDFMLTMRAQQRNTFAMLIEVITTRGSLFGAKVYLVVGIGKEPAVERRVECKNVARFSAGANLGLASRQPQNCYPTLLTEAMPDSITLGRDCPADS